jgi:shikimate dehydrogenase
MTRPLRFAVVGDPIAHSKSPAMHAAAFAALGLPHAYEAIRATEGDLPRCVEKLRAGDYEGMNVTVPHKQRILALVDAVDESAKTVGCANTLVRQPGGRIVAHNTDVPALAQELEALAGPDSSWHDVEALVLGAGGAARAAVAALGCRLCARRVVVRARRFSDEMSAKRFVDSVPCPVTTEPWARSARTESRTLAVVQATSAGMQGAGPGQDARDAIAWDALPGGAVALDVVYCPRDTPWLNAARARGLRAEDGLGMLARQGALALELWLGVKAPLGAMRSALESP